MDEMIEAMLDEVTEEAAEAPKAEEPVDLNAELDSLRRRLEVAERTAREISAGWREFTELYPDADISPLPDSFNADIEPHSGKRSDQGKQMRGIRTVEANLPPCRTNRR